MVAPRRNSPVPLSMHHWDPRCRSTCTFRADHIFPVNPLHPLRMQGALHVGLSGERCVESGSNATYVRVANVRVRAQALPMYERKGQQTPDRNAQRVHVQGPMTGRRRKECYAHSETSHGPSDTDGTYTRAHNSTQPEGTVRVQGKLTAVPRAVFSTCLDACKRLFTVMKF